MPALDDYLHYRMVDVSSIKELCRRWYPRIYFGQPEKGLAHRALADINEPSGSCGSTAGPRSCPARAADQRDRGDRRRDRRWERGIGGYGFGSRGHQRLISPSPPNTKSAAMVSVVQLVEHQVVVLEVAGSSPVTHPTATGAHHAGNGDAVSDRRTGTRRQDCRGHVQAGRSVVPTGVARETPSSPSHHTPFSRHRGGHRPCSSLLLSRVVPTRSA